VFSIAFSPAGTILALGSSEGDIAVWDPLAGKELLHLKEIAPQHFVNALAFSPDAKTLAAGYDAGGVIRLWELASAAVRHEWPTPSGWVRSLAFSPDGKYLASAGSDTTALIWDVRALARGTGETIYATREILDPLWADLADGDAAKAFRAINILAALPERSVPFLAARLRPIQSPDPERLTRLLAGLDSDQFAVRDQATRDLEALGELAEASLRKLLAAKPSLETRRRIADLLHRLSGPLPPGECLRCLRALEVLERAGTKEAQRVLQMLANGAPQARLTREAKAALSRRSQRKATP
jgi:hypothetical protein